MRKSTIAIVILATALAVTNAYWLYYFVDAGVSYSYLEDSYRTARGTAVQALALLPIAARSNASQAELINAVAKMDPQSHTFNKDGFTWVGSLGLRFDPDGRLIEARSDVDPL